MAALWQLWQAWQPARSSSWSEPPPAPLAADPRSGGAAAIDVETLNLPAMSIVESLNDEHYDLLRLWFQRWAGDAMAAGGHWKVPLYL